MTRLDRRALFAKGSAAALLSAVGISAEAAPKRGGHLRAALSGGDRSETWATQPGGIFLQAARRAVFETLTEIAADGTLQPGLAQSWTASDAGRVWTFDLVPGVSFHDGTPLAATHVAAALQRNGLVARGKDTHVTVYLMEGSDHLPFTLAADAFGVGLKTGGDWIGTGLYRAHRFVPGQSFLGKRVASHRKDGQAGWFDSVEFVSVPDAAVRAQALRDGLVDVADLNDAHGLDRSLNTRFFKDRAGIHAGVDQKIATAQRVAAPLDDLRFAERWWMQS